MKNENLEQDLGWAPVQYPGYNTFETGEWRIIVEDGAQTGVVYTNFDTSSGVQWLRQTELVMKMRKMFLAAAASGTPALEAYGAVTHKFESSLRPSSSGTLDGLNDTFKDMMQQFD